MGSILRVFFPPYENGQKLLELAACTPHPIDARGFNPHTVLPYGLTAPHIQSAMSDFINFSVSLTINFTHEKLNA